jgi:epoxyqueuosine reductase QueG
LGISDKIRNELYLMGASLVGFADLTVLPKEVRENFDYGIAIGLAYSKKAMQDSMNGDARQYWSEFTTINKKLPELAVHTANLLIEKGYKALAKVSTMVVQNSDYRTVLPHKTVATLAGLGFIGKCAALVTKEFGSAVRVIVVLTNAPVECGVPVTKSLCEWECDICAKVCPGNAVKGRIWEAGMDRDVLLDPHACRRAARQYAKEQLGIEETLCGLCISNCPWTKKALKYI